MHAGFSEERLLHSSSEPTQAELDKEVARLTGETRSTISSMGFSPAWGSFDMKSGEDDYQPNRPR